LIGEQVITPIMGSSLMNDSRYVVEIMENLIQAAETLFVSRDEDLSQTVHEVLNDHHELDNVITNNPEPVNEEISAEKTDGT
jgi:hypothetical protein